MTTVVTEYQYKTHLASLASSESFLTVPAYHSLRLAILAVEEVYPSREMQVSLACLVDDRKKWMIIHYNKYILFEIQHFSHFIIISRLEVLGEVNRDVDEDKIRSKIRSGPCILCRAASLQHTSGRRIPSQIASSMRLEKIQAFCIHTWHSHRGI